MIRKMRCGERRQGKQGDPDLCKGWSIGRDEDGQSHMRREILGEFLLRKVAVRSGTDGAVTYWCRWIIWSVKGLVIPLVMQIWATEVADSMRV